MFFLIPTLSFSQIRDDSFYLFKKYINKNDTLNYRLLEPYSKTNKKEPLLIFLHGSGERGDDNKSQLIHGGDFFLKQKLLSSSVWVSSLEQWWIYNNLCN